MWFNHAMEYYLVPPHSGTSLKLKDVLTRAIRWVNVEGILLREISQAQKDLTVRFNSHAPGVAKFIGTVDDGCRGWGEWRMKGWCFMGSGFHFCRMKKF